MTNSEKEKIKALRAIGQRYSEIANALGLSKNQVSAFCRRNISSTSNDCLHCGNPLKQVKGRKTIKFCNSKCRTDWWNTHQTAVHKKAYYNFVCNNCGKEFTAYGNSKRKYCSHKCYISDRFSK